MAVDKRIEGVCFIREWPEGRGMLTFWCPGCQAGHTITYGADETWQWNGDTKLPTFTPSVLALPHPRSFDEANPEADSPPPPQMRCHSFVTDGRIQYLTDSEHAMAGQRVDMVPLPDRYARFLDA